MSAHLPAFLRRPGCALRAHPGAARGVLGPGARSEPQPVAALRRLRGRPFGGCWEDRREAAGIGPGRARPPGRRWEQPGARGAGTASV